jgi:GTP-binding protein
MPLPIIAIIGRPNVGKSTLFNRIVGGRKAITLDVPGVTRDRHYGHADWAGHEFICVDTGGLFLDEKGSVEKKVREQVELAIREAAVILLLMDGREGLLPEEKEIGKYLRRSGKTVFFVVNKVDTPRQEEGLTEFYALGEEISPVSAEHGLGVNDLLDRVVAHLPPAEKEEPGRAVRVAIIGRPNVGKSSLLNRLIGEERVVVHEEPGTTRDAIDTSLRIGSRDYLLIDTAGIRKGGKSASKLERYSVLSALKTIERSNICLLLLDAGEGISKQDAHVAGFAAEARKGILLVWNKWDLVKKTRNAEKRFVEETQGRLKFLAHAPLLFLSALTGEGCAAVWPAVDRLDQALAKRIATPKVNEVLERLASSHNPPVYKGRPVKFFYATQTGVSPPTFVVFASEPEGVHFSFQRYLVNGFRKAFDFDGAPIEIYFRRKR